MVALRSEDGAGGNRKVFWGVRRGELGPLFCLEVASYVV